MIVQAKIQLYIPCPCCVDGRWRADQLNIGQSTTWTCENCRSQAKIMRMNEDDFDTTPTGFQETPVTVTLQSRTEPKITLKLNTWKYDCYKNDTKEEYDNALEYLYNVHTCPTNWMRDVEQIEYQGNTDPHGVFEFVSVDDGHFVDPWFS